MADDVITRRRELRRRKILENSEDRLQKVLGQKSASNRGRANSSEILLNASGENLTDGYRSKKIIAGNCDNHKDEIESYSKTEKTNFLNCSSFTVDRERELSRGNCIGDNLLSENSYSKILGNQLFSLSDSCCFMGEHFSPLSPQSEGSTSEPKSSKLLRNTSTQTNSSWLHSQFLRKGILLLLAFLIQFLLFLNIFETKPIIIPFLMLELGLVTCEIYFQGTSSHMSNSFISSGLLLCGISTDVVTKISIGLCILTNFFDDLLSFLFSFLIFHWFCKTWDV